MYTLQEYNFGHWNDFYNHNDYEWLTNLKKILEEKYPDRRYRVIEVIEVVWYNDYYVSTINSMYASFIWCISYFYLLKRFII